MELAQELEQGLETAASALDQLRSSLASLKYQLGAIERDAARFDASRRPELHAVAPPFEAETASAADELNSMPEPSVPPETRDIDWDRLAEEARREEVRLAVERASKELLTGPEPMTGSAEEPAVADDDEARREAVRKAVEDARSTMSWAQMRPDSGFSLSFKRDEPVEDDAPVEEVRLDSPEPAEARIASFIEASAAAEQPPETPAPIDDDEARREAVRRAVEEARAEMATPTTDEGFEAAYEGAEPRLAPILPSWGPAVRNDDFAGPPVIVFDDPEGRVELSQVFATLSRIDRSTHAALLNYSPHTVTIGLSMLAPLPQADELMNAVQAIFGRRCSVRTDGNRTTVEVDSSGRGG
jgi:hypothetical protein